MVFDNFSVLLRIVFCNTHIEQRNSILEPIYWETHSAIPPLTNVNKVWLVMPLTRCALMCLESLWLGRYVALSDSLKWNFISKNKKWSQISQLERQSPLNWYKIQLIIQMLTNTSSSLLFRFSIQSLVLF